MREERRTGDAELQRRYDELSAEVARNRVEIDALQAMAEQAIGRADASDERVAAQSSRMDALESRVDVDRRVIAQLQADGLLNEEHAAHLTQALASSRKIGAAIGIIMAERKVDETSAFELIVEASQQTNRKLRLVAYEVVSKGDASGLPPG